MALTADALSLSVAFPYSLLLSVGVNIQMMTFSSSNIWPVVTNEDNMSSEVT